MKIALLAIVAMLIPSPTVEVKHTDEWENWSDRMILQFRPEEWDGLVPPVRRKMPSTPVTDA